MNSAEHEPSAVYATRESAFLASADALASRGARLMHVRVAVFTAAVASALLGESGSNLWLVAAAVLAAAFIGLVAVHRRIRAAEKWQRSLATANRLGIYRLERAWPELPVLAHTGGDLAHHPYADDLDVLGRPALTQLLAPVFMPAARSIVRQWFLEPDELEALQARQAAVQALAPALDWRDEMVALGLQSRAVPAAEIDAFLSWAESGRWLSGRPWLRWIARVLPLITVALAAAQATGIVSGALWLIPVIAGAVVSLRWAGDAHAVFQRAFAREGVLQEFPSLLAHAARVPARTPRLDALRAALSPDDRSAAEHLASLTRIMRLSEVRFSTMMHLPVQLLTMWDFHVLDRLEQWQTAHGANARAWLAAAGEIEGCAAIAATAYDNPTWCFPTIDRSADRLTVRAAGHPMLPTARCVRNDVEVGPRGTLLLVTGSNMSGKSTLLRALGCNVVLAQAGAPVCADEMTMPPLSPFTSGRIRDSLTEGVSLFLAELQRMRAVVDAARNGTDRTLFYLLDEMLHGTNTAERRIAARTVIEHLLEQRAIGVVTTHDLSLAEERSIARNAVLAHFTETVTRDADGLHMDFDYTLRPGIATSTNALALLEIVGLQRHDDAAARISP